MATKKVNIPIVFEYDTDNFDDLSDYDYIDMAVEATIQYPEILHDNASVETVK